MTTPLLNVPPTRNSLLALRHQAAFLQQGLELLERKRELLTRLVYQRIDDYRRQRRDTRRAIRDAYRWLGISTLRMGSRALHQAALGMAPGLAVEIVPRRSLGVEYPAVASRRLPLQPVGLLGTDASFDQTRQRLTDAALLLAHLGELEMALSRLMAEQRKAQKRVNALRHRIIPRYHHTIHYIESVLEEEERSNLFRIRQLRQGDPWQRPGGGG